MHSAAIVLTSGGQQRNRLRSGCCAIFSGPPSETGWNSWPLGWYVQTFCSRLSSFSAIFKSPPALAVPSVALDCEVFCRFAADSPSPATAAVAASPVSFRFLFGRPLEENRAAAAGEAAAAVAAGVASSPINGR